MSFTGANTLIVRLGGHGMNDTRAGQLWPVEAHAGEDEYLTTWKQTASTRMSLFDDPDSLIRSTPWGQE